MVDGAVPPEKIREYQTNPDLQDKINIYASDAIRYVSFNLAVPPFDDVHVRKAVSWAQQGFRQLRGGESVGELLGHIMVNSLEDNILADYDPYQTPNGAGDPEQAKAEMAQSVRHRRRRGLRRSGMQGHPHDHPTARTRTRAVGPADPVPRADRAHARREAARAGTMYNKCNDADSHHALCAGPGWGKDYADGITFGEPLFSSAGLWESCCNLAARRVGRSARRLGLRRHVRALRGRQGGRVRRVGAG